VHPLRTRLGQKRRVVVPGPLFGRAIEGLPDEVRDAYAEARKCFQVQAFTAAVLLCRKLLMYVAVNKGDKPNKHFVEYIDYLVSKNYVSEPMKPWVTRIKDNGNEATHELPPSDEKMATDTLQFTATLLHLIYEIEHQMGSSGR